MHVLWLRQCFTTFFLVFGGLGPLESLKFTLHLIAKFLGHSLLAFLILLSSSNDRTICFMRWFQISSFNLVSTFCTKIYKYTWQVWCLQFHPLCHSSPVYLAMPKSILKPSKRTEKSAWTTSEARAQTSTTLRSVLSFWCQNYVKWLFRLMKLTFRLRGEKLSFIYWWKTILCWIIHSVWMRPKIGFAVNITLLSSFDTSTRFNYFAWSRDGMYSACIDYRNLLVSS